MRASVWALAAAALLAVGCSKENEEVEQQRQREEKAKLPKDNYVFAPVTNACLLIANHHITGEMDGFTLMRLIKDFGGGDLMTGVLYMALILLGAMLLVAVGCAFHSGDRHAFVRKDPKLVKGHHGKIVLCWLCSLVALLPMILAIVAVVLRYVPLLSNLTALLTKQMSLPSTKESLIILAAGAVLTLPLLPLRSMIPAAFVDGLEKEKN